MVTLHNRRLLIDGQPRLVFAGEVHYFRLRRDEWDDRVRKAKALGCQAIASYIPWIFHEETEGDLDVTGKNRPETDVAAFIDLCHRHGLWFIPRPGPFIMAEMKNEGIPFWVYEKHPDAIPVSWEGATATTRTLDYLNPGFLGATERWYAGIMPILASRLQASGGPVIAVQLDNEIGMLSWVTNLPDLTEEVLCDLSRFIQERYSDGELAARYPFDLNDPVSRTEAIRRPSDVFATHLHRDLGDFYRDRNARYIAALRGFAEAHGVRGVPFIVNIHGSGGGRGTTFPIGIHQLYPAYTQSEGYLSGSDHYLGELTRENVQDLYFINAFMGAVHRPEQPLTSLEFEVGTGDYGVSGAVRMSRAAADFKARLSVAQGNRLLNYYILTGGRNPHLLKPVGDGNDRVAFTGERHGFAAPISPEGELDPTYFALQKTTLTLRAVAEKLADMDEEHDRVALAFVPDYYKTDFHRPGPMRELVTGLEAARGGLEAISRAMLFLGLRYPAVDIQNQALDPKRTPAIVLAASEFLDGPIQERLVAYVRKGGRLLVFGELPTKDMEAKPCTVLADAFRVTPGRVVEASARFHPSVKGVDWASDEPEVRVWRMRTLKGTGMESTGGVFLRFLGTDEVAGVERRLGEGSAIFLMAQYPFHPRFYRALFNRLGVEAGLTTGDDQGGLITTSTRNVHGERFLHLFNLDMEARSLRIRDQGKELFDGRVVALAGRQAKMLPIEARLGTMTVRYATTELLRVKPDTLTFLRTGFEEAICLRTSKDIHAPGCRIERKGQETVVTVPPRVGISDKSGDDEVKVSIRRL